VSDFCLICCPRSELTSSVFLIVGSDACCIQISKAIEL